MKIRCSSCRHTEEVNVRLVLKILGVSMVGFGGYAWVAYLFAGTGLALPICVAIVTGGAAMLVFKDEIVKWLKDMYPCPACGKEKAWEYLA